MKNRTVIILIAIMILSAALLLTAAVRTSFWEDETFTAGFASQGLETIRQVQQWDVHPPLYLYIAAFWGQLFGFDEFGLRYLSIVFAELAVALLFLLALSLFDEQAALLSAALLAFSPLFIMFAHQARYYALACFLAMAVVLAMWKHLATRKWFPLVLYIFSSILIVNVLFAGLVVVGVCALWWLAAWVRQPSRRLLDLLTWLGANLAVLAGAAPALKQFLNVAARTPELTALDPAPFELVKRLFYSLYVYSLGETISPLNPAAWVGGLLVAWILLAALRGCRRKANFWLPALLFAAILAGGLLATLQPMVAQTWQNLPVRGLYGLPLLILLLVCGLDTLKPKTGKMILAVLLLVYALGIFNFFSGRQYLRPIFAVQWRLLFSEIAAQAKPEAIVVCGEGDSACNYYSRQFGFAGMSASSWAELSRTAYSEVWWIQNNVGRALPGEAEEARNLSQLADSFAGYAALGFGEQDPGIRQLKTRFTGQDDYQYRAVVHHFYQP